MQPNFLVIGAMKAGTSSLHRYLSAHPQVFMPDDKEPHFFTEAINWKRGIGWYESLFEGAEGAVARGEASTTYSAHPFHPGVPGRIASVLPEVRLIYLIRHPIERLQSQWLYRTVEGKERGPVEETLLHHPDYLNRSRYATQIEQYLEHFPRSQLLVIVSEKLRDEREETMRRVFRFLEVDDGWMPPNLDREYHRTAEKLVRRPSARKLRSIPGYSALARRMPRRLRALNYRLTTRSIDPARARLSEPVRRQLEDELRDEVLRLQRYVDASEFAEWGLG